MPDFNSLVNAMKGHWSAWHTEKKRWTDKVALLSKAARLHPYTVPVRVEMTHYSRDRRRDPDGIRTVASKFILDGLVVAGVLPDDSQRWVLGFTDHFEVDKQRPRVVVRLWPQEEEGDET